MRRRWGGRPMGRWCCCGASCCSSGIGLPDPGLEEALSHRLSLPAVRGPGAGGPGAGPLDLVALSQRAGQAGSCRAAAGRAEPAARCQGAGGQDRHADRRHRWSPPTAGGRGRAAPVEGRSARDASWNAMPEQPLFGYKAHVAVDQGSGLVRQAILDADQCVGQDAVPGSGAGRRAGGVRRQGLPWLVVPPGAGAPRHRRRPHAQRCHGGFGSGPPTTPATGRSARLRAAGRA